MAAPKAAICPIARSVKIIFLCMIRIPKYECIPKRISDIMNAGSNMSVMGQSPYNNIIKAEYIISPVNSLHILRQNNESRSGLVRHESGGINRVIHIRYDNWNRFISNDLDYFFYM